MPRRLEARETGSLIIDLAHEDAWIPRPELKSAISDGAQAAVVLGWPTVQLASLMVEVVWRSFQPMKQPETTQQLTGQHSALRKP